MKKNRGAALLIFMIFFLIGSTALTITLSRSIYSDFVSYRLLNTAAQSFYVAESGVEDMAYRFVVGKTVGTSEVVRLRGATATTTFVYDNTDDRFDIVADASLANAYRTSALSLYVGSGASFNFGVQSGNGGFTLTNGSSVVGNVFSNGSIIKTGGGTATITGDAISASVSGLIKDARILGTARAHSLQNNYIGVNAYYVTDSASTVVGTRYTPATDELPATMPISDADINKYEQYVTASGTIIASTDPRCSGGTYIITSNTTLGFTKVECNLEVRGNNTDLTLLGTLWVTGNITFKTGSNIIIHPSVGSRVVPIIADNPANRLTSSKIVVENSTSFAGSGNPKSYVILISQNNDAENGGAANADAIEVQQSSYGDLLVYASHGRITMGNSASLKEVTGYQIVLGNSAVITYESGLVNLLFTTGPGGGYTIGNWRETF